MKSYAYQILKQALSLNSNLTLYWYVPDCFVSKGLTTEGL